jgi:hypothetical protein
MERDLVRARKPSARRLGGSATPLGKEDAGEEEAPRSLAKEAGLPPAVLPRKLTVWRMTVKSGYLKPQAGRPGEWKASLGGESGAQK